jgi:hypothetical protein
LGFLKQNWLSNIKIVNFTLVSVSLWRFCGLHIILFIAGIQSVQKEYYEAAAIDGASQFQQFINITIPGIKTVIELVLFLNIRGALTVFDAPFSSVAVSGALKAELALGAEPLVVVSGDDNLLELVETEVSDGALVISPEPGVVFSERHPLIVRVTAPALAEIEASGASDIVVSSLDEQSLSIEASGASVVFAAGRSEELSVDASGASRVHAAGLRSRNASVEASGASTVQVGADCSVDASASGGSTIQVRGDAAIHEDSSGGSSIGRIE